jgi:hypothetical protein
MRFFSSIALEDIRNMGLYIKTDEGVRNIESLTDIEENTVVLVFNVPKVGQEDRFMIKKGTSVRCAKAYLHL